MRNLLVFVTLLCVILATACGGVDEGSPAGYVLADFGDLPLEVGTYWNGADGAGGFVSGRVHFANAYNAEYASWDGFAYADVRDQTTPDYTNSYSAMSRAQNRLGTYGIAYVNAYAGTWPTLTIANAGAGIELGGMLVTNTVYTYYTILNGNDFARKFGGEDATAEDWFKLTIRGLGADGEPNGKSVETYLADYRAVESAQDFILADWTYVDLGALGAVTGLRFELSSSDNGDYGMNTPAYFALGELTRKEISE